MKERPILFNGEMVRAILAEKKTQTRRLCKAPIFTGDVPPTEDYILIGHDTHISQWIHADNFVFHEGDRLWVRETFSTDDGKTFFYRADGETYNAGLPWTPSIHMKYGQHRMTLEVTAVRVERLQDISEEDARAEGIEETPFDCGVVIGGARRSFCCAYHSFEALWRSIYGDASWDANPWVWVYEFKITERKGGK